MKPIHDDYTAFLASKKLVDVPTGLTEIPEMNPMMLDFQHDITAWALRRGRAAIFADCGMGKSLMQLEWAQHVPGKVLIFAPLAVAAQTIREAKKFKCRHVPEYRRHQSEVGDEKIVIANYEMIEHFDFTQFGGLVIDESSILKSFTGKIRNQIIEMGAAIPFRLACTATPAPNDFMELGNHAEFVGSMGRTEMLAMFFVHDGGDTAKWRLKGHAQSEFWAWVCSWAVTIRRPSDLGYDDRDFILPNLNVGQVTVRCSVASDGMLFAMEAQTLQDRITARRNSIADRVAEAVQLVASQPDQQWLIWCKLNEESRQLAAAINGAVEVKGADSQEFKEKTLLGFAAGEVQILVSKPEIAGFGMNFQSCHNMIFVGLSDSFEQYYQAVRRCWRFGQEKPVNVHIVTADIEGAVVSNINRKEADAERMAREMVSQMREINRENIKGIKRSKSEYMRDVQKTDKFEAQLGDCIDVAKETETGSVDYTIFSPPFASLYTYSNSDRDMGNAKDMREFESHFKFLIPELYRITKAGRLLSFHCMNLPAMKERDGYIGMKDFRGDLIKMFQECGWIFHSEVCIWKDPLTEATRTKALGLMHKQLCKDSTMCRQGIPDYLVTMRKPGDNPDMVAKPDGMESFAGENEPKGGVYSHEVWRRYASPVWMDIRQTRTLAKQAARDSKDERHICPLQLDVIERCIQLWTNSGDLVYSPFMGIGSEGYVALQMGRRFKGSELKRSYWTQSCKNLARAKSEAASQLNLLEATV